jgi:DNA-binding XRE family transcriptional regulator
MAIVFQYYIEDAESNGMKPVECPALKVYTCAKSDKQARAMLEDAIMVLAEHDGYSFTPKAHPSGWVSFDGEQSEVVGFFLRRNRMTSLADAARLSGLHANSLGRWERGEQSPSLETFAKVIREMNLPFDIAIVEKNSPRTRKQQNV